MGKNFVSETNFDVLAIGNAIVDILGHADDSVLANHGLIKGTMELIDSNSAKALYKQISPVAECSGGSAANTIAGLVSLGRRGAFIGKVGDDHFGQIFTNDIKKLGAHFETRAATSGSATGTSLVLVTPDADRTMQTCLGASLELGPSDVNANDVAAANVTFLEGYLWDSPCAQEAFIKAADFAHNADRKVALSLSDTNCVDRHRKDFAHLVDSHIDIVFANENEIMSLYQAGSFFEAIAAIRGRCGVAAITRGELGCVIITDDDVHSVPAETVKNIVDTTGAGDAFAAGFLSGYIQGYELTVSARMGNIVAGEAISHIGARPVISLKDLVAECLNIK